MPIASRAKAWSAGMNRPCGTPGFAGLLVVLGLAGVAAGQTAPSSEPAPTTQPHKLVYKTLAPPTPEEEKALATAGPMIDAKRYLEAVQLLEPLAESRDTGFDLLFKLAGVYDALAIEAIGRKPATTADRQKSLADYNTYGKKAVDYYLRAGFLAFEAPDPRAKPIYERVLGYKPGHPTALKALARLVSVDRNYVQATYYYREYLKTEPGKVDYLSKVILGGLLVDQGLTHQAIDILLEVRDVGGADAERHLARAYEKGKQYEKALATLDQAIQRYPADSQCFLARAMLVLGQPDLRRSLRNAIRDTHQALLLGDREAAQNPEDDVSWSHFINAQTGCEELLRVLRGKIEEMDAETALALTLFMRDMANARVKVTCYSIVQILEAQGGGENATLDELAMVAEAQSFMGRIKSVAATAERILRKDPNNEQAKRLLELSRQQAQPASLR